MRVNNEDLTHFARRFANSHSTVCTLGNIPANSVYDLFNQSQLAFTQGERFLRAFANVYYRL